MDCNDCHGEGSYWTEWSNKADEDLELCERILERPYPPDGTVLIKCKCQL